MIRLLAKNSTLFLVFVLFGAVSASAQVTIVGYDSTNPNGQGGDPSPDLPAAESVSDVDPFLLSRGPGLTPNSGITFNSNDWSTSADLDTSSTDYVRWGWGPSTGVYDLENMTIQYDRSGDGPRQLAITVQINQSDIFTVFTDSNVNQGDETHTIDLSSFENVSSAQFRLFGFDANSLGGTLDIERFNSDPEPSRGIVVRGYAVAVPEPHAFVFMTAISIAFVSRRRRTK